MRRTCVPTPRGSQTRRRSPTRGQSRSRHRSRSRRPSANRTPRTRTDRPEYLRVHHRSSPNRSSPIGRVSHRPVYHPRLSHRRLSPRRPTVHPSVHRGGVYVVSARYWRVGRGALKRLPRQPPPRLQRRRHRTATCHSSRSVLGTSPGGGQSLPASSPARVRTG